jgi:sec-independent protein translocase protein TatC
MPAVSDEERFQRSTMTFGEHLEELRGALWRAILGLVVGIIVALFFAGTVVRWIEIPLKKGLQKHYLEKTKESLQGMDHVSAGHWALVEKGKLVPERVWLDPGDVVGQLRDLAGASLDSDFPWNRFQQSDLTVEQAGQLARQFKQQALTKGRPERALWDLLSPGDRLAIESIANAAAASPEQRDQLVQILNRLVDQPNLQQAFSSVDTHSSDPRLARLIASTTSQLNQEYSSQLAGRLNRDLLWAVFNKHLEFREPQLVQLVLWKPADVQIQALSVHEPFMIYVKAAFVLGLILSSPWVFYQIWAFVAEGLYRHEKRFVYLFLPLSVVLFFLGAALAFCFVFQPVLDFLFSFNRSLNVDAEPRITDWISFVLLLPVGFGISFQLPLVMLFLERIGVFSVATYLHQWRLAVLVIFVVSMFLTPADPISMLLMALPLTVLYFGGIGLCQLLRRRELAPH